MDEQQERAESQRHFDGLLGLLIEMIQARVRHNVDVDDLWIRDAETLARKFVYDAHSVRVLLAGCHFAMPRDEHHLFVPHGSISVLLRSAMEAFVTFAYTFPVGDEPLLKFRYQVWQMCGLKDRQKFVATGASAQQQMQGEALQITQMLQQIELDPHFQALPSAKQKDIRRGDWNKDPWPVIASEAGIHKAYFAETYAYLCSYSHASFLSVLQLGQATLEIEAMMANTMMETCNTFIAAFIIHYSSLFPWADALLKNDPRGDFVTIWHHSKKDHEPRFGPEVL